MLSRRRPTSRRSCGSPGSPLRRVCDFRLRIAIATAAMWWRLRVGEDCASMTGSISNGSIGRRSGCRKRWGRFWLAWHPCAPGAPGEQNSWYHSVSEPHQFDGWLAPPDPASLIMCHRDLHPENVLADPDGAFVVLDGEDTFGPATPGRELACGLFDWFCDGTADLEAMSRMYEAYLREGGPGRITEPADFTMLIAIRLNFLHLQTRIARDPRTAPAQREWAQREVEEFLRITPTPRQLEEVLELISG